MANPTKPSTKETQSETENRVIKFERDNFTTLETMSEVLGTDIHTTVNAAMVLLGGLEVDEIVELMNDVHQQKIARIKAQFS